MKKAHIFDQRRTGILLHITSLPSGNLGEDAYRFVDFLVAAGVTLWQVLPLGPTHSDGSPYQCLSVHAGNNKLICLDTIRRKAWANPADLTGKKIITIMAHALRQFTQSASTDEKQAFQQFCQHNQYWLDDYVLFRELRHLNHATAWYDWPDELRDRDKSALYEFSLQRREALMVRKFEQFMFYEQWSSLKQYANERGVKLFGDMPIFVAHDSADVWAEPELFTLDETGQPETVAGVPPDYFSETGQRWGNPLYRWQKHEDEKFQWWQQRLTSQLLLFDLIRIDHFRGFEACWEIPAHCQTAVDGEWQKAPGEALFSNLLAHFGELPLVAEDLGIITEEVTALREQFALPGMNILQFAFGGDATNPYLPHQHRSDSVTYTGTHDNDTTLGWYQSLDQATQAHLHSYLGESPEAMPWLLIRTALQSVSELAVIPMQDILALDGQHRMNTPGTTEGNWQWKFDWEMLEDGTCQRLAHLNALYGRV